MISGSPEILALLVSVLVELGSVLKIRVSKGSKMKRKAEAGKLQSLPR